MVRMGGAPLTFDLSIRPPMFTGALTGTLRMTGELGGCDSHPAHERRRCTDLPHPRCRAPRPRLERQGRRLGVVKAFELSDRFILWPLALQGLPFAR